LKVSSGLRTHVIIYATNTFGPGPGHNIPLIDRALPVAVVGPLYFRDMDPEVGSIGGEVHWSLPGNPNTAVRFTACMVFVAEGANASKQVEQGTAPADAMFFKIPRGTAIVNFTHIIVYTSNLVGMALVGTSTPITDRGLPYVTVDSLQFFDQDLGAGEFGGAVEWVEPHVLTWLESYAVYACSPNGSHLFLGAVARGSARLNIPFDSTLSNFRSIVVIASNEMGEARVNSSIPLVDRTVQSCPTSTSHRFMSPQWRVAALGEAATAWRLRAIRFYRDGRCRERLPAIPRGWPRRPRQSVGQPFANPPVAANLHAIFGIGRDTGAIWMNGVSLGPDPKLEAWWSTPGPCVAPNASEQEAPNCYVGFSWESDTSVGVGRAHGSSGNVQPSPQAVHCVEVEQGEASGQFARGLALQYYDRASARFRTLLQDRISQGGTARLAYQPILAAECNVL